MDIYFRRADGAVGMWQGPDESGFRLPGGAVRIDAATYEGELAELREQHAAYLEQLREADRERAMQDLVAVRQLGLPEATARRLAEWDVGRFGEPDDPPEQD